MSEIAQRALSPGLNDPRTAVDIVRRLSRLLDGWVEEVGLSGDPVAQRVRIRPIPSDAVLREAFDFIARDGAAFVEVQTEIQSALARLAAKGTPTVAAAARRVSERALERSDTALELEGDRAAIYAAAPSPDRPQSVRSAAAI